jgi:UDP-3-O-[3-hydroxymyristoyl] glucosamine N-acyltransferase
VTRGAKDSLLGTYTLGEIAARIGGTVRGDAARKVAGIRSLGEAGPDDLSFVAHPKYRRAASMSRAAGLLASDREALPGHNLILVANPYAALAGVIGLFFPPQDRRPGISPRAEVAEGVRLGPDLAIGPFAVVGRGSSLGDGSSLMAGAIVGEEVTIGPGCVLHPGVVVYARSVLGARVVVHAGAVIGSDGFGYAEEGGVRTKIPQVGNVVIEDDVEIGACVAIDRATFGSTIIGRGSKIDNLVQIGHNVVIGEDSVLVAQSGIAGSTRIGRGVILAGQAGVGGHLNLADGAIVGAKSAALQDLPPKSFVLGIPATDHREWKRGQAALRRLPDLLHRVARLERALQAGGTGRAGTASRRRGAARGAKTAPARRRSG